MPNVLTRPPALTTIVFEDIHEEGIIGSYGRCHLLTTCHPYRFVSRQAAGRFATVLCERGHCDGFRLHTPGFVPPKPLHTFDDSEIPF
ncbi:hypothetical protein LPC08_00375 [Roseomonas sp. OT10]|uniref:hypothetical protein n=1 Tax=Roseomonas cutis TaxID=2897332 RepID=UPI001E51087A|nr:hypothetical protein [Roseomonas sp. OT10]UFN49141.1 hypothetical protein LPC08_00375 [Roseomonas sp. OT10]